MIRKSIKQAKDGIKGKNWAKCEPRKKNVLIDYERLKELVEAGTYDQFRNNHKGWISDYLDEGEKTREEERRKGLV